MQKQTKKWFGLASFGVAAALMLGLALAQSGYAKEVRGGGKKNPEQCDRKKSEQCDLKAHKGDHVFKILHERSEELGLSPGTLQEIDKIQTSSQDATKDLRKKTWDAREELRAMLDQETPNQEAIMKKVDDIEKLEADKQRQRVSSVLAVQALLTKEQRAKLKELREECRKQCKREDNGDKDSDKDSPEND